MKPYELAEQLISKRLDCATFFCLFCFQGFQFLVLAGTTGQLWGLLTAALLYSNLQMHLGMFVCSTLCWMWMDDMNGAPRPA